MSDDNITSMGIHANDNYRISRSAALRDVLKEIESGEMSDSGAMLIIFTDTGENDEYWNTGYRMVQSLSSKGISMLETVKMMLFEGMGYNGSGE